jgi:partner of Y14 and mago protein
MPSQPSSSSRPPAQPSKAGITTDENGIRHIPASVRPDGTVRKEIKIKPGYRPPEDVEVYKNRTAEAWKNRGKGGVPGADPISSDTTESSSAAANKNAKRREARKKAAAAKGDTPEDATSAKAAPKDAKVEAPVEAVDPEVEKEKNAKKLAKKLRQARELKDKKEAGSALLPEQFEKVIRINELIRQLDLLGFDSNGEKKEAAK